MNFDIQRECHQMVLHMTFRPVSGQIVPERN